MVDLKVELEKAMKGVEWNFIGILDTQKQIHPIPKNIQIQAIFEYMGVQKIKVLAKKWGCKFSESINTQSYPDIILEGGKLGTNEIVAVDIKTTRRINNNRVSGFTIGSYGGYFRFPTVKKAGCSIPYYRFTQHWIIGFVYDWDDKADTIHMVSNLELIVQEKWKIASKTTGTGTTTAIASIKDISKMKKGQGTFKSEKEFLDFWRRKPLRHER